MCFSCCFFPRMFRGQPHVFVSSNPGHAGHATQQNQTPDCWRKDTQRLSFSLTNLLSIEGARVELQVFL